MGGKAVISDDEDENEIAEEDKRGGGARDNEDVDDDDEEEGQDEYEKDGFIVDDVDEEEGDSDKEKHMKKKKRKKRESKKNFALDEDDYELLKDNNVTTFHRPKLGSKNFKRLKKAGRDSEQVELSGFLDNDEVVKSSRSGQSAEEKLKRSLFGDDEGTPLEDIAEDEEELEEGGDIAEEDEMADFIVDEEVVDKYSARVRRKPSKIKLRQTAGASSSALQEAHGIFGDVDELLMKRKQGLVKSGSFHDSGEWSVKNPEDEFEPFILTERYKTEKDDQIQEIDVPERIQLLKEITGHIPTDDKSIEEESAWIYNQLTMSDMSPFFGNMNLIGEINKEEIGNVLGMLHVQKLDIPFIAMYRKELCLSLLKDPEQDLVESDDSVERTCTLKWHKKLWAIQNLDRKWLILQKRKTALQIYYNKRFQEETRRLDDETRLALKRQLFKSVINSLKASESEREVDDVDLKFNLYFPPGEVVVEDGQFKRPTHKSLYSICCKAGLWEVARKFGLSSEQFGLLLNLDKMRVDELEDPNETPEEIAANFTCAIFETPKDVLKGARHMVAVEISSEPCVRKHVRSIFMEHATVSTSPTSDGNTAIDSFHQFSGVKWLCDKPLSEFKDAQWLLIQKAEEEKLLQVSIKLPENVHNKLMSDAKDFYLSDGVSRSAQLWNEQRELILKDSFFNFLLPSLEKEVRSLLTVRSKNWLLMDYGKQLWEKVSVAPYHQKEKDSGSDNDIVPRVMACCWAPGKPATTFVMLDSSGEMLDVLYAGSISLRSQSVNDQQRKKNDEQRLVKFMTDHQPQVVVVGAVNLYSTRLKDDIFEIIYNLVEKHSREDGQSMSEMSVVYGDESLPRLYENSRISSDQLTGQPGIVKRAVALGRYLQNPLCLMATLCGPGREILSWKLNPLEHFLSPDEKYGVVEQVMIDATNQVGVDINLAAHHEWLFAPLQFVSGLGPRKASALQRAMLRTGAVFSRKEIPMNGVLKKKVFINAVGFLRVRRNGLATTSNHTIDLLDDTRIHPESYDLAKKMVKDIYDEGVREEPYDMDDDAQQMVIEHVRYRPKPLKALVIEEYCKSVEERLGTRKRETLCDIQMELLHGFQDWRSPYREPNPDDVFYMISSETKDTLLVGRIVQATVSRVQSQRLICELGSGLTGVIFKEDFSDEGDVDLAEKVIEGSTITCKIKVIQRNRYQVLLTSKESELCKCDQPQSSGNQDPYYDEEKGKLQIEQDKGRKERKGNLHNEQDKGRKEETGILRNEQDKGLKEGLVKKHFKRRMIVHHRFQNLTADEAIKFLSDKDPGESIIHPSARGPSYLTLTLKVYDGVYTHKEIVEGGKDHKDITSLLCLGKTLKIGEDTFEDLDEVVDRYVDPLVAYLKVMLGYRKFQRGSQAEVDELLRVEKAEHPMRIVYCFGISYENPGAFILSYIRSTNLHHEFIGLCHNGYKFRKQMFAGNNSIDKLVAYFQRHVEDFGPTTGSVAAMVSMKGPGIGGSSGRGSASGGWGGSAADNDDGSGRGQTNSDWDGSSRPGSGTGGKDYRDGGYTGSGGKHNSERGGGGNRGRYGRGSSGRGNRDGGSDWGGVSGGGWGDEGGGSGGSWGGGHTSSSGRGGNDRGGGNSRGRGGRRGNGDWGSGDGGNDSSGKGNVGDGGNVGWGGDGSGGWGGGGNNRGRGGRSNGRGGWGNSDGGEEGNVGGGGNESGGWGGGGNNRGRGGRSNGRGGWGNSDGGDEGNVGWGGNESGGWGGGGNNRGRGGRSNGRGGWGGGNSDGGDEGNVDDGANVGWGGDESGGWGGGGNNRGRGGRGRGGRSNGRGGWGGGNSDGDGRISNGGDAGGRDDGGWGGSDSGGGRRGGRGRGGGRGRNSRGGSGGGSGHWGSSGGGSGGGWGNEGGSGWGSGSDGNNGGASGASGGQVSGGWAGGNKEGSSGGGSVGGWGDGAGGHGGGDNSGGNSGWGG
ncbi:transcription elongation factor SPT6 homolog isoform X2 [Magnolia sinica]|uniref:transcription elongation factor SPT6 homolog isoform X2 n=1 Tax=Magnolia sinica TaxID=86752 RepID=UPI00265A2439|nr:transcription elongation factor SPT6 homolog isoform X2 [Magnolia sinica]